MRHVNAVEQHLATRVGLFQSGDDAQGRGLAAARGSEKHDGFAGMDGEVQWLKRPGAVGKGLRATLERDRERFADIGHSVSSATNFTGRGLAKACRASNSGMIIRKNTRV